MVLCSYELQSKASGRPQVAHLNLERYQRRSYEVCIEDLGSQTKSVIGRGQSHHVASGWQTKTMATQI